MRYRTNHSYATCYDTGGYRKFAQRSTGSRRGETTTRSRKVKSWTRNLDDNGIVASQEAIAKGIRPLADDKEGTKGEATAPDYCSQNLLPKAERNFNV